MRINRRLRTSTCNTTAKPLVRQSLSAFRSAGSQTTDCETHAEDRPMELSAPGLLIQRIGAVPSEAILRSEKGVLWLDTECGGYAELDGADYLYRLPRGMVIAVVASRARLALFDGESHVAVPAGIWRIVPHG